MNPRLYSSVGLALFVFGIVLASTIFVEVQVLSAVYHLGRVVIQAQGYPWWGERLAFQSCLVGPSQGTNCGFLNYAEGLTIALSLSMGGFFLWRLATGASLPKRLLRSLGETLLVFGVLVASVVFVEVQVLNSRYEIGQSVFYFEGFPFGGQEALGSSCLVGDDIYHCVLFNYDQLLLVAVAAAFAGLVLWNYYGGAGVSSSQEADTRAERASGF